MHAAQPLGALRSGRLLLCAELFRKRLGRSVIMGTHILAIGGRTQLSDVG
ncbi:hypothetical protein BZL30_3363 [Mycobacterium kansasii]|uniref:Uncharacterized protein n=1 Tax=Mycobacterium kansasii TaxID=1768 RepID=A0A1V3X9W6_MYCKA|nr:hypothetical protein BZL30_3363 [Mycobacterium kansasii]